MVLVEESWLTLVRMREEALIESHPQGSVQTLIGPEDSGRVAASAHLLDVDATPEHYHRRSAELHYVLEGEGIVVLDGRCHAVQAGSIIHVPPGVIHATRGHMRLLVIGVPDLDADDTYYLD